MTRLPSRTALAEALRAHAVALRATADVLEAEPSSSDRGDYVDQHTSPLSKTVYLKLAKEKAFPTGKVGRRILARWDDFDAFLATRERKSPGPRPVEGANADELVLIELGLQPIAGCGR